MSGRPGLGLRGRVERPSQGLEDSLGDVVRLLAVDQLHVQVRAERVAERAAEFLHEDEVEVAHEHRRGLDVVDQVGPAADVHRNPRQ